MNHITDQPSNDDAARMTTAPAADHSPVIDWLKLMRLPTVFSAVSNVLAGYLICSSKMAPSQLFRQADLWILIATSICLFLAGMILNDAFDARLDATERPERPIPSGRIQKSAAFTVGFLLILTGLALASLAGRGTLLVAVAIATGVLLYDGILKNTFLAPAGMAWCRFGNLILGSSVAVPMTSLLTLQNPAFLVATGLAIYIAGVTLFAMNEAGRMSRTGLVSGLLLATVGIVLHLGNAGWRYSELDSRPALGAAVMLGILLLNVLKRGASAIRQRQSVLLQKTVGYFLMQIIFFDATMTLCLTGHAAYAALVLILVLPAVTLKKVIPLS